MSLPTKLSHEPIIDALFEVRFNSQLAVSELLPGFLYKELSGNKSITSLPVSQIPLTIREADPGLRFTPIKRLDWQNFFINISEHSVSLACKLPYQGWHNFKNSIKNLLEIINNGEMITSIERYSIKYVNLIPAIDLATQIKAINLDLNVANHKLQNEVFQIRVEIPQNKYLNIINLVSSASIKLVSGEVKQGVVVDIDSICATEGLTIADLLDDKTDIIESIRQTNKTLFFSCLKDETINSLGATYD